VFFAEAAESDMPDPDEPDDQASAETFDETNITPDGRDIATSDLQRDVYDATGADEDATEALAPEDDFDPDAADEAELEEILQADEDLDEPRTFARDDANLVPDGDATPASMESEDRGHTAAEALDDADSVDAGPDRT
jgi:hypothetical protein